MTRTDAQASWFGPDSQCSRCTAAPLMLFVSPVSGFDLPFCGHHGRANTAALLEKGFTMAVDLTQDPSGEAKTPVTSPA